MHDAHTMRDFVVSALRFLAEIPGVPASEDDDWPLRVLDVEDVEMRYSALSDERRTELHELWLMLQAVIDSQRTLQLEANSLIRTLTERMLLAVPYDEAADELLRGCIVHRELTEIIDDVSPDDTKVLLSLARCMRDRQKAAAHVTDEATEGVR